MGHPRPWLTLVNLITLATLISLIILITLITLIALVTLVTLVTQIPLFTLVTVYGSCKTRGRTCQAQLGLLAIVLLFAACYT